MTAGVDRPGSLTERDFVFNVVWTGSTFDHLNPFASSLLAHSGARFRFLANACPSDQLRAMDAYATRHSDRVVEVVEVSTDRMVRHGDALDEVLRSRDDGELFCFIDPDILARAPYLAPFADLMAHKDAVTSGREVWSTGNVRPEGHPGVNGEHFFDQDGFVFGSPHLAVYRREALTETIDRWGIGFSSAGNDVSEATRARLDAAGRAYWIYDTGKIVNILFQLDGHRLCHRESDELLHIGGVAHYLAPPSSAPAARDHPPAWGEGAEWGDFEGMADRYTMAAYTADVLRALCAGRPATELPTVIGTAMRDRLALVRDALIDLIATYGSSMTPGAEEGRTR